jgi:hypothetical protein
MNRLIRVKPAILIAISALCLFGVRAQAVTPVPDGEEERNASTNMG